MIGGKMMKLLAVGIGTITAGTIYSQATLEENKSRTIKRPKVHLQSVMASYTSDFEPSVYWDYNWDRMQPGYDKKKKRKSRFEEVEKEIKVVDEGGDAKPKPEKPTAVRNIFLIRHGQYNLKGEKDVDRVLTPLGRIQAAETGLRLNQLARNYNEGKGFTFNSLIHSTMSRASETATIIHEMVLPNDPMTSDPILIEGAPIPPEPPTNNWRPEQSKFFKDNVRIESAFREYFHRSHVNQKEDSYDVIVCHANVIRYFVCRALQLQPEAWLRFSLHNGSITWIRISPSGSVSLRMLGCAGHMDPELMTTT